MGIGAFNRVPGPLEWEIDWQKGSGRGGSQTGGSGLKCAELGRVSAFRVTKERPS